MTAKQSSKRQLSERRDGVVTIKIQTNRKSQEEMRRKISQAVVNFYTHIGSEDNTQKPKIGRQVTFRVVPPGSPVDAIVFLFTPEVVFHVSGANSSAVSWFRVGIAFFECLLGFSTLEWGRTGCARVCVCRCSRNWPKRDQKQSPEAIPVWNGWGKREENVPKTIPNKRPRNRSRRGPLLRRLCVEMYRKKNIKRRNDQPKAVQDEKMLKQNEV